MFSECSNLWCLQQDKKVGTIAGQNHLLNKDDYGIIVSLDFKEENNMKDAIRKTAEFKTLRNQAREALEAYADGADFDFTIARLAGVGYKMELLLG